MAKWYCTHCCIKRELYTAGASPVCVLYTKWQSGGQWWWWWWCKQIPAAASLPSVKSENTIQSLVCLNGATGVRMWNAFPLQHKQSWGERGWAPSAHCSGVSFANRMKQEQPHWENISFFLLRDRCGKLGLAANDSRCSSHARAHKHTHNCAEGYADTAKTLLIVLALPGEFASSAP